jgi:hypothetical protein
MTKEYSDQMTENTGVESSVTEDEMKQYVNNVMEEINANKKEKEK